MTGSILSMKPIGSGLKTIETWNPQASRDLSTFTYIDLGSVNQDSKMIENTAEILFEKAPSRARQIVSSGDVLVSTVRPNLNSVAIVPEQLDGAIASTGFCVLRPDSSILSGNFLFHWVKSKSFIREMVRQSTGANYPAVTDRMVKASRIPLPKMTEQKHIAAILDKVDSLRRKRQQAIDLSNQFLRSVFLDMFGDPVTNPKGWEIGKFDDIAELNPKPLKFEDDLDVSFVPMSAVSENSEVLDPNDVRKYADVKKGFTSFQNEDVLFAKITPCMENGKAAIARGLKNGIGFGSTEFHVFRPKSEYLSEFIYCLLHLEKFRKIASNNFSGAVGHKRVPKTFIEKFELILPPVSLIQEFSVIFNRTRSLGIKFDQSMEESDDLFSSLSQKAFAGEL